MILGIELSVGRTRPARVLPTGSNACGLFADPADR
jgi:hypothetical protein